MKQKLDFFIYQPSKFLRYVIAFPRKQIRLVVAILLNPFNFCLS